MFKVPVHQILHPTERDNLPDYDGYTQNSFFLDRDLRIILTHMVELSRPNWYVGDALETKTDIVKKSLTPAIAIELFLYRKCSNSFLTILDGFTQNNPQIDPALTKVLTTYSSYRQMYPTDILINRRLGIYMSFDNEDLKNSSHSPQTAQKLLLKRTKEDKQNALLYLKYIKEKFKLDIPVSDQQISVAIQANDQDLLNLLVPDKNNTRFVKKHDVPSLSNSHVKVNGD